MASGDTDATERGEQMAASEFDKVLRVPGAEGPEDDCPANPSNVKPPNAIIAAHDQSKARSIHFRKPMLEDVEA